jgi:hypothetical protein
VSLSLPRQRCKSPISSLPGDILGYRFDGRPIFPIAGGSEPLKQDDPPKTDPPKTDPPKDEPPQDVRDEFGRSLGFPEKTRVEDMKPEQQAAYWRTESKKQQKAREEAERKLSQNNNGSGTVRDQQQQTNSDAAVTAARDEGRREAAKDAARATLEAALALRGKSEEESSELLGVIDPAAFLTSEGKTDAAKVTRYVDKVAPAGNGGGGTGGTPGQGRFSQAPADPRAIARAEAEKRGYASSDKNRGALGGLRK